ncbi:uncharacterized protein LOC111027874 [Myzus persicae]|uniref:uncharacterized protein LOC111027874 n=1 Tax=Myzus persicae TaxID=13164 RepID=UPI000B93809E|nr:uncharacterized protein LOC111027874 [Myzus persicae]
MQVLHFYLVSILSCVNTALSLGGLTTLYSPGSVQCTQTSQLSKLQPQSSSSFPSTLNNNLKYKSQSNNTSGNISMINNSSNAQVVSGVNGNESDPFTSENGIGQLSDVLLPASESDKPGKPGTDSFNLYKSTVLVFRFVFNTWLEHKEELLKDIANKCGISNDIVQIVNGSMTQLFKMQRNNRSLKLSNLAKTFYYMFDVKHMIENFVRKENIISKIQLLIEQIESDINMKDTAEYGESDITSVVQNLKGFLENYKDGKYNNNAIMVNIGLMKGMMLINLTEND